MLGFSQMTLSAACAWALSQVPHSDQIPMLAGVTIAGAASLIAFVALPRPAD